MCDTYVAQMDGEDTALVMVKFANGAIGQIFTGEGFAFPANDAKFHAIGERGEVYGNRYELYAKPRGMAEPSRRVYPPTRTATRAPSTPRSSTSTTASPPAARRSRPPRRPPRARSHPGGVSLDRGEADGDAAVVAVVGDRR